MSHRTRNRRRYCVLPFAGFGSQPVFLNRALLLQSRNAQPLQKALSVGRILERKRLLYTFH